MTREEKIAELINIRDNFNYTLAPREVFDDAIKAIEQEPFEDAVSRQAVLEEIQVLWNGKGDKDYCMETLRDFVTELQPVTPTHTETVTEFADRCRECGREKVLDKIRAEIETQEKWLAQSGYNAYNVDIAFNSIKLALAEMDSE